MVVTATGMNQSLRILMVSEDVPHPNMGGLALHAIHLAKGLARAGHEVDFMGSRHFPFDEATRVALALPGQFYPELSWIGGWKECRLGFFNPIRRSVLARRYARAILRRAAGYDVIHYHGHVPDVGAFIPKSVNFVQTRHDQGSDCVTHVRFKQGEVCTELDPGACAGCISARPNRIQTALSTIAVAQYRRRVRASFTRHKTVFVSEMLRRNFSRTAGPGRWGSVVHNFLDLDSVKIALKAPWRPASIPPKARLIVYAGKLYPPKGISPLLAALMPYLPVDTHVAVLGDGPQEQTLRASYGSPQVHFFGWQDRASTLGLMAGADILVLPSVCEEPCATTVLEGLALGKTIFALALGGTPELRAYETFPGQLRLFDSMEGLVSALVETKVGFGDENRKPFVCTVDKAVVRLMAVYLAPPDSDVRPVGNSA